MFISLRPRGNTIWMVFPPLYDLAIWMHQVHIRCPDGRSVSRPLDLREVDPLLGHLVEGAHGPQLGHLVDDVLADEIDLGLGVEAANPEPDGGVRQIFADPA